MNEDVMHVVFAGGGTGGHLFPGLAVAEQLQALATAARITMATGGKPFEHVQVAAAGFDHLRLPSHPLDSGAGRHVAVRQGESLRLSAQRRFLRATNVSLVVGLGGYASVPMAWAAAAMRVPLVLLEQNAIPGRATRWFAPRASLICTAFEETRQYLKAVGPIRVTGNPIRAGFLSAAARKNRPDPAGSQLLILGGSGGSRTLNEQVPRTLYKLQPEFADWRIVHQTGPRTGKRRPPCMASWE